MNLIDNAILYIEIHSFGRVIHNLVSLFPVHLSSPAKKKKKTFDKTWPGPGQRLSWRRTETEMETEMETEVLGRPGSRT